MMGGSNMMSRTAHTVPLPALAAMLALVVSGGASAQAPSSASQEDRLRIAPEPQQGQTGLPPGAPVPDTDAGLLNLGYTRLLARDSRGAREALDSLLARFPDSPRAGAALFWKAFSHEEEQNHARALALYEEVVTKHPASPYADDACYKRGEILELRLHDYDRALAEYERLVKLFPASDRAALGWYSRGEILTQKNDYDNAIKQYDNARTQAAGQKKAARDGMYLRRAEERIAFLQAHAKDHDGVPLTRFLEAQEAARRGRAAEAADRLAKLLADYPDAAIAPLAEVERALALAQAGRADEARGAFYSCRSNTEKRIPTDQLGRVAAAIGPPPDAAARPAPPPPPVENARPVEVTTAPGTGVIAGVITFAGAPPAATQGQVPADRVLDCGKTYTVTSLMVDPATKGVRHAVVYLDKAPGGKPAPQTIVLDQLGCVFMPHIVVAPVGTTVQFKNSDAAAHNVNVKASKNAAFNKVIPAGGAPLNWTAEATENVQIDCDFHSWMRSYVIVKDHPFVAVTDAAGAFTLADVPPGEYTVKCWHETLGIQPKEGVKVRVEAGKTAMAAFPPLRPR
jgi:tetratricopeptide (TPR) repeat protein/plastocyanin